MQGQNRRVISGVVLVLGLLIAIAVYFWPVTDYGDVAKIEAITADRVTQKITDEYQNHDEKRVQTLHLQVLSGKYRRRRFVKQNYYVKSQIQTQRYRAGNRVLVGFTNGTLHILSLKRDWVLVLAVTLAMCLTILLCGKRALWLLLSLLANWLIYLLVIKLDIWQNGTNPILLYSLASVFLSFVSLLFVQGLSKKMLATWLTTLSGIFAAFALSYWVMKLTNESGLNFETLDYATQDPRSLFLAQTLIGVLGAVMDEATDIVSSLAELGKNRQVSGKQLLTSGLAIGQANMGPLINVLVLLFIAEELPMMILYLRDNNTLASAFNFTLSLGAVQSVVSAIGIVLTIIFASIYSLILLKPRQVSR